MANKSMIVNCPLTARRYGNYIYIVLLNKKREIFKKLNARDGLF